MIKRGKYDNTETNVFIVILILIVNLNAKYKRRSTYSQMFLTQCFIADIMAETQLWQIVANF